MQAAIEDIVTRGISEIRKNAFGEDLEDAKNLPWSREQAWALMKKLSQKPEVRDLSFMSLGSMLTLVQCMVRFLTTTC